MDIDYLKRVVEGALLATAEPLSLNQLNGLFDSEEQPGHGKLRQALAALDAELEGRAVELREVGSGFRLQIRTSLTPVISRLWAEKTPRYSRALLETLAIIAYRQPVTRAQVEEIRGVALSSSILRTLQEREWVRVVGHRDVPGRPELLGTTKKFLDYFNLKSLDELPTLAEIKDIENLDPERELQQPDADTAGNKDISNEQAPQQKAQQEAEQETDEKDVREKETVPAAGSEDRQQESRSQSRHANPGTEKKDPPAPAGSGSDRKSTRLNSSHVAISY